MFIAPLLATWLVIASPHFELMTNAGAKAGRQALTDLERIREALGGPAATPLPR